MDRISTQDSSDAQAVMELYPHQKKALQDLKNGSILWGDVGTGKSLVAVKYYLEKEAPKDVIVITTAKKRDSLDWVREFAAFAVGRDSDSTVAGVLTVDSWNNIGNHIHRTGCFFIFDEQRIVGSGRWSKAFIHIARNNRWILLSATPGDTWLDYIPAFIANGFYRNRTEFQREHVVFSRYSRFPKVDRFIGVRKLERLRDQILVEMPFTRLTVRHTTTIPVEFDKELQEKALVKRWHVFENRPLRDVAELFSVMRKIVNSHSSRLGAVQSLLTKHPRLIVFYNFDYELEILRSLCNTNSSLKTSSTSSSDSGFSTGSGTTTSPSSRSGESDRKISSRDGFESGRSEGVGTPNTSTSAPMTPSGSSSGTGNESWPTQEPIPKPAGTVSSALTTENSHTSSSALAVKPEFPTDTPSHPHTSTTSTTTSGSSFQLAEWNGHKHEPIPETDRWVYLVQYAAGSEGWNCTSTNAMCFYSLTYSYKQWHQAHGRIDRLDTRYVDLFYYVLMSNSVMDRMIHKSLMAKKSFNVPRWKAKFQIPG